MISNKILLKLKKAARLTPSKKLVVPKILKGKLRFPENLMCPERPNHKIAGVKLVIPGNQRSMFDVKKSTCPSDLVGLVLARIAFAFLSYSCS